MKRTKLAPLIGMLFAGTLLVLAVFTTPPAVAQVDFSTDYGTTFGIATSDLKDIVIKVVQWVLGLLVLVGVILLIYGGIIWMTSAGNKDKIDKAKRIIISTTIGLVIILLSWAIVTFIIKTIQNATNPGPTCTTPGEICATCMVCSAALNCDEPIPGCVPLPPGSTFKVTEIETAHAGTMNNEDVFMCSRVQPNFNNNVLPTTVDAAELDGSLAITELISGAVVPGTWNTSDKVITFMHQTGQVFNAFTEYVTHIPKTLKNTNNLALSECVADGGCLEIGSEFQWHFRTNDQNDTIAPYVASAYPMISTATGYPDRTVPRDPTIYVNLSEAIDLTSLADGNNNPLPDKFKLEQIDAQGGTVVSTVDPTDIEVGSGSGNRIEFNLMNGTLLEAFKWYRITLQDVEDLCGNPLQPPEVWEFMSNDSVAGIRGYDPTGDRVCPDTTVQVVFTMSMYTNQTTINFSGGGVTYGASMNPSLLPGPDYTVPGANGSFTVLDPNPAEPWKGFKVFQFTPTDPLASNSDFTVDITTDRIINGNGDTLSGNWSFSTATPETCACKPFVNRITPEEGNPGQCVTIRGSCFTGTVAHPAVPRDPEFDVDFGAPPDTVTSPRLNDPPARDFIVTTIPASFGDGDDVSTKVTIDYTEPTYGSEASNVFGPFMVTSDTPGSGPCLFSMDPSSGHRLVDPTMARGVRFGANSGEITFYDTESGPINSWSDSAISTAAPANAASGSHDVFVTDSSGNDSNPVPYEVLDYAPGEITVINPKPVCDAACVNTLLQADFRPTNIDLDLATLHAPRIQIRRCTDETCTSFNGVVPVDDASIDYSTDTDRLIFGPSGVFDINQWYAAMLIGGNGGILGVDGQIIANPNFTLPPGLPAFLWKFKTKNDPNLCTVDRIELTPTAAMITHENGTKQFRGAAYASPDSCDPNGQQIATDDTWNWTISPSAPPAPDAEFLAPLNDRNAVVRALRETSTPPAPDAATVQGAWGGKSGTAQLTIDFLWCDETTDCTLAGLCPGSTCNVAENKCTPIINDYSPTSGEIGTWVTINGCYFGSYRQGECSISGNACDTSYGDCPVGETCEGGSQVVYTSNKQGLWPGDPVCQEPSELWRNSHIIASEVPNMHTPDPSDDAANGPVSIFRGIDNVSDSTNDPAPGEPISPDFTVNLTPMPGICSIDPDRGAEAQPISIYGQNYGTQQIMDKVRFGPVDVASFPAWNDTRIDAVVPPGLTVSPPDIDISVLKGPLTSNTWPFTVLGPTCTAPCFGDGDCSPGLGCGYDSCCGPQPGVLTTYPTDGESNVCRNTLITATFDRDMDAATMDEGTVILTVEGGSANGAICGDPGQCASGVCTGGQCVGDSVSLSFSRRAATELRVAPGLLLRFTEYRMLLSGLRSAAGVRMPDYDWTFTSADSDQVCQIRSIDVEPSLWTPTAIGQTQAYTAVPNGPSGPIAEIPGVYDWSWSWLSSVPAVVLAGVITDEPDGSMSSNATTQNQAGEATLSATATIQTGPPGQKTGTALVIFDLCENPWSFVDAADNCDIPGDGCANYNFQIGYCRDGTDLLPNFDYSGNGLIKGKTGDILKQYLFKEADASSIDAIGLRVYANAEFLSPQEWYRRQFPFNGNTPSPTIVDGYAAVRDGRTTYVAATNFLTPLLSPTLYILSYNNDATPETLDIFTQMLNRLHFNINGVSADDKQKIIRDTKRITDLQDIAVGLEAYKLEQGDYPSLDAGTYLLTMSTSRWPSWQSTLGNSLGQSLAEDPVNVFSPLCPAGFDPDTCWNEPLKQFLCTDTDSHIYAYKALRKCTDGATSCTTDASCVVPGDTCGPADDYILYSSLEYSGIGNWTSGVIPNPCNFDAGQGDSNCSCFNYQRT